MVPFPITSESDYPLKQHHIQGRTLAAVCWDTDIYYKTYFVKM